MKGIEIQKIEFVFCHRMPERSFFFRGKQFPVCARCTGIIAGYLAFPFFLFHVISINLWIALLLNLPALIDGYTQALELRSSNNLLRLITGLMSGFGQMAVIAIIGDYLAKITITYLRG